MDFYQIYRNDAARILIALFIQIWLSYPIRFISNRTLRYTYSIVLGTALQFLVFGRSVCWIHVFGVGMYILVVLKPGKCGAYVTFLSMLFLSWYHLNAILYRYGAQTMDEIVLLMILVCKYSLFAYAFEDGHHKMTGKVTFEVKQRQINMITQKVSLLDYFGYIQFLPTSVMGPPIEYRLYRNFMDLHEPYLKIPSTFIPLRKTAKEFAICALLYGLGEFLFPTSYMKTENFWESHSLFIGLYTSISITFMRFKYYTAWKVSIASIHSSGISFEKDEDFTAIAHCKPEIVETTPHIRDKIGNWNIMVQEWLRKCIYMRSPFKSKMSSQLYVFMVSAFWHGYYAGYYFAFFMWFAQLYLQGQIFKYSKYEGNFLTKIYNKMGKAAPYVTIVTVNWFFGHNATFFYLLEAPLCFKLMQKMHFIPQLIPILLIVVFFVLPPPRKPKQKQQ